MPNHTLKQVRPQNFASELLADRHACLQHLLLGLVPGTVGLQQAVETLGPPHLKESCFALLHADLLAEPILDEFELRVRKFHAGIQVLPHQPCACEIRNKLLRTKLESLQAPLGVVGQLVT